MTTLLLSLLLSFACHAVPLNALEEAVDLRCVHGGQQIPIIACAASSGASVCSTTTCSYSITTTSSVPPTSLTAGLVVPGPSATFSSLTITGSLIANQFCTLNSNVANANSLFLSSDYYANMYNYQVLRTNASIFSTFGRELILTPIDGVNGDLYGSAVAMSGDGSVVVVGAPNHTATRGAIYIYRRQVDAWVLIQEITDPLAALNDNFGDAVAISYDASTIVVASHNGNGLVYAYTYNPATGQWVLTQVIAAVGSGFGFALSTSATGQYIVASNVSVPPQAAVFVRNECTSRGSLWLLQQVITTPAGVVPSLKVAISGDASTLALGLPTSAGSPPGSIEMFTRSGAVWSLVQTLTASDGNPNDLFGSAVTLSSNGQYLLASALQHTSGSQVYDFTKRGPLWNQETIFVAPVGALSFGVSLAISGDGTVGIIGAATTNPGNVYVALRSPDNIWSIPSAFTGHTASSGLGRSVACSADGAFMVAGGPDLPGATPGSASIFRPTSALIPADTIISGASINPKLCINVNMIVDADLRVTSSIFVNGSIITGGVTPCMTPSDGRLKTDIEPLTPEAAYEQLKQLMPVTFNWINPEAHAHESNPTAGLIAQEVGRYFPHWIYEGKAQGKDAQLVSAAEPAKLISITPELYAYLVACVQGLEQKDTEISRLVEFCKNRCTERIK